MPSRLCARACCGPRSDRPAGNIHAFGEPSLLAGSHRHVIERIGIGRIEPQYLVVAAHRLCQRTLPVQQDGFLQQCGGGILHGTVLVSWRGAQLYRALAGEVETGPPEIGPSNQWPGVAPRGSNGQEHEWVSAMSRDAAISQFVTAQDGLKLHVRDYGHDHPPAVPVVCLPGLARSGADFEDLATALATDSRQPRRVLAIDSRGRGKSEYDPNPANYNLAVELADVLAVLTALGIGRAVFVGTSRGGLLTMLLAVARPTAIAGCVLNDIGPEIDPQGLARIKSYVGKLPQPENFADAAAILRRLFGALFPKLGEEDWTKYARRTFKEADGRLVPDYDVKLGNHPDGGRPRQAAADDVEGIRCARRISR